MDNKIYAVVGVNADNEVISLYYGDNRKIAVSWFETYSADKAERGFISVHLLEETAQA